MLTILTFIVVLGITITVHEFGHFAMAKLLKIRVLIFSLGFGPKLWGFTKGGTEYRISPFPIGGYVKMAGETFDEDRKGDPGEFLSHPKWHRFLVAIAGPFMNILLFIGIMSYMYTQGTYTAQYTKEPAIVGPIISGSIANRAGLQSGDRIVSVHGASIDTWEDLEIALSTAPRDALDIEVLRNDRVHPLHFEAPPRQYEEVNSDVIGFRFPRSRTIAAEVEPGLPAHKGGLIQGDEILEVRGNGNVGKDFTQILNIISESKGIPLQFTVRRLNTPVSREKRWAITGDQNSSLVNLTITPIEKGGYGIIGFKPDYPSEFKQYGLFGAVKQSVHQSYALSTMTFRIIGRIFKGSASMRNLNGPIGIARISGSVVESVQRSGDASLFFDFLAVISLQLGIFNLLPIPILDGGVIALLLVEGIMRRDLSLNIKEKIVQVGFVFIIMLMGFVVFNDLSKIIDFHRFFKIL